MGVLGDFLRALGQIGDPRFRTVLWRGLALTLALLIAVTGSVVWGLRWVIPDATTLPLVGDIGGLDAAVSVLGVVVMLGLSVFLMVPVASAFTGLFLDDVSDAVERRHYPHLAPVPGTPFWAGLSEAARLFAITLILNLMALIMFFFIGPLAPMLFWAVNGYLLGREFFMQVAMRRMPRPQAMALRRSHSGQVWLAGSLMAVALNVPVVNLLVPVLASASFTHTVARLTARS